MFFSQREKTLMVSEADAIVGRDTAIHIDSVHPVLNRSLNELPSDCAQILLGMGCFWGAERRFWQQDGVFSTSVGYAGGYTKNPMYEEVCSGRTGHTEVVRVVYKEQDGVLANLLKVFWEAHDPTQGMRQGNDIGTQYRSAMFCFSDEQLQQVEASKAVYQTALAAKAKGQISTEIRTDVKYYFAEDYHQQYLYKNPNGYCGLRGTGVSCDLT